MMNIFLLYVAFLERDLIPAQMRISHIIRTTAMAKKKRVLERKG